MIELVGYIASALIIIAGIPQIYKLIKTKSSEDISLWLYIINIIAGILWLVYSIALMLIPIIIVNVFALIMELWTLRLIIKYNKNE